MAIPFDVEPRFYGMATGQRIQFNPDHVLSCEWELVEAGGTGQVIVKIAVPFEQCPVQGGDIVEVWALSGETVPRCRAIVAIPDPSLDLKEAQSITAYGRMEDMNHVVIDRVDCFPGGQDLSWFTGHIADDYAARRPGFDFVRDIQTTGVALETFNCATTTARAAMDQLQKQAGRNAVWGWDIDPQTGLDRFYLRPRVTAVGHQWFVGDRVKVISGATDFSVVTNAIKIRGGDAKYPQLLTNPSFEVPQIPTAATGDLLVNGGFEQTTTGGSTSAGGNTDAVDWTFVGGASRNAYDPGSNHNSSAHTGRWYALLDHVNEEVWQEIPVSLNVPYTVSLYAALESGSSLSQGQLIVEARNAGGAVVAADTPPALDLAPPSTAWVGGQGSTVLAGNAISMPVLFTDASTTHVRVRIVATANVSAQHGLLIDDVVFAAPGEVGQLGWSTHLENPSSSLNKFVNLDWANLAAAWEGLYGVRAQVIADPSNKPAICPFPGDDSGANGYHFKPAPQQTIRCGVRLRMSPGLNTAAGLATMEYREWAGDGHQTQFTFTGNITIPNDGAWHWIYQDVTAHGDAASATTQVTFDASGTYDIDGFTARDVAAGESGTDPTAANYLRTATFERYVRAEDVCTVGSDAAGSAGVYGRRESIVSNKDIVDWNADAIAWAKAYFDRNAVPINRNRVELIHEPAQIASPGEGTKIQVSGLQAADILEWPSRIQYTWAKSRLALQIELSNERPTMAKLLKQIDNSSTGGGSASAIAAAATGKTGTPATLPEASATVEGILQLAGDLTGTATAPALVTTGVTAGAYGDASHALAVTFDAKGRATAAANVAIAIPASQVTGLPAFVDDETPGGTPNGILVTFSLAHPPAAGSLRVYLGTSTTTLYRLAASEFSVTGSTLTMGTAPPTGSVMRAEYRY